MDIEKLKATNHKPRERFSFTDLEKFMIEYLSEKLPDVSYDAFCEIATTLSYKFDLQMAIKALEKQIPKKPKVKEETYSRLYDCPSCGGYLVSKIDGELCSGQKYKYCHRCGQALDWSDT